jgi:hypothetical protein
VARLERLEAEYRNLRDDERAWSDRVITLGSIYVLVAGGTFFVVLENKLASQEWIYIFAPVPAFAVIAIVIRQAITATARGRLLIAYECALTNRDEVVTLATGRTVPISSTYHAQLTWLQGRTGGIISIIECSPFLLVIGLCVLSIASIHAFVLKLPAVGLDLICCVALLYLGIDGLISPFQEGPGAFDRLEQKIACGAKQALPPVNRETQ